MEKPYQELRDNTEWYVTIHGVIANLRFKDIYRSFPLPPKDKREQLLDSWLALMEDGPAPDGPIRLPVLSGSMLPEIPVDSMAHIEKSEARRCSPGDVVVYRDKDRLVIHRVLLRLGWGSSWLLFEKGDANDRGGWIKGSLVRGKVVAVDSLDGKEPKPCTSAPSRAHTSLRADLRHRFLALPRRAKHLLMGSGK